MRQADTATGTADDVCGRNWSTVTLALVGLGIVVAVALRIWILSAGLGAVDMDEAVSGLMARHALHGHVSVFFWGQTYGGSQESIATAVVFALLGPSRVAVKVVPMLSTLASAWLVWRIGRRTLGDRQAPVAAVLFLLGPTFFVLRSTRAYGFYSTALLASCAILLAVLRLRERATRPDLLWLGFAAGVGWWATPQIVFVAAPALVWLAVEAPGLLRRAHLVLAGAVAGAAPWLCWTATHGWAALRSDIAAPHNTYLSHLQHFFGPLLPEALGLRIPYAEKWYPGPLVGIAAYVALLAVFGLLLWKRPERLRLLLVAAVAYPFVFAISPASFYAGEPRYLYLLSPVIALLLARALATPARQVVGVVLVATLSIVGIHTLTVEDPLSPRAPLTPVLDALRRQGVDRAFAPYHIAYRLDFDGRERIIVSPLDVVRWRPFNDQVRSSPRPGYVLIAGSAEQVRLERFLASTGRAGQHERVGQFDVYVPGVKVLPEEWPGP